MIFFRPLPQVSALALSASLMAGPALAQVDGEGFDNLGFDRSERAYRFTRRDEDAVLDLEIDASEQSPLFNVPIVIERWGTEPVGVRLDDADIVRGESFRYGYVHTLHDSHLILWIAHLSTTNTRIRISTATE